MLREGEVVPSEGGFVLREGGVVLREGGVVLSEGWLCYCMLSINHSVWYCDLCTLHPDLLSVHPQCWKQNAAGKGTVRKASKGGYSEWPPPPHTSHHEGTWVWSRAEVHGPCIILS